MKTEQDMFTNMFISIFVQIVCENGDWRLVDGDWWESDFRFLAVL